MIIKDNSELCDLIHDGKPIDLVKVNGETVYMRDATVLELRFTDTATAEDLYRTLIDENEVKRVSLGIKAMPESRKVIVRIPASRPSTYYFVENDVIEEVRVLQLPQSPTALNYLLCALPNLKKLVFSAYECDVNHDMTSFLLGCDNIEEVDFHDLKLTGIQSLAEICANVKQTVNLQGAYFPNVRNLTCFLQKSKLQEFHLDGTIFPNVDCLQFICESSEIQSFTTSGTSHINDLSSAFSNCKNLESIDIETSDEINLGNAFLYDSKIKHITIRGAKRLKDGSDIGLRDNNPLESITCSSELQTALMNIYGFPSKFKDIGQNSIWNIID